mgnify:CR=1 FL=1
MKRTLYNEEHLLFQDAVKTFIEREVSPNQEAWMEAGIVDREAWRKAGEAGVLCPWVEEKYGGPGGDFLHSCIVNEEMLAGTGLEILCEVVNEPGDFVDAINITMLKEFAVSPLSIDDFFEILI